MLKEFLLKELSEPAVGSSVMPGVQVWRFSLSNSPQDWMGTIPAQGSPLHFETFFCLRGHLIVNPRDSAPYRVEAPGILLLSDSSALRSCQYSGNLGGILIAVDAKAAKESLAAVCSALGMRLDTRVVKEKLTAGRGCMAMQGTPWTQAFFETLRCLPKQEQERYCVFKAVELLYLLCAENSQWNGSVPGADCPVPHSLVEVRAYLQAHLSEKLTIPFLCKQFSLSSTFLKEGFRRAYGMPIHSFLIQQRLRRARELIRTTRMPIQQIAQAVGYEGMSQFNAAFKREYGTTPGQYRKMSETATPHPF